MAILKGLMVLVSAVEYFHSKLNKIDSTNLFIILEYWVFFLYVRHCPNGDAKIEEHIPYL